MNHEIILSIAIPTYNRAELLKQTLKSVIDQKQDGVEIIVSDNASTDHTSDILKEYVECGLIKYYRNSTNVGMDGNFLNLLEKADGKYVQFLSDDDVLLPGAVCKVLDIIEKEKPDYIHLNSYTYNTKKFNTRSAIKSRITLKEDLVTCDKKEYMDLIGIYITFLSSTIIKRENFLEIRRPEKFSGTYFMHAHVTLTTLEGNHKKVIITKKALVAAKGNNTGGYNLYEVWVKQYKRLLLVTAVKSGFEKKYMEKMFVNDMKGTIRDFIFLFRISDNSFDLKNRSILVQYTLQYPGIWIKTYPVAFLPPYILHKFERYYK
ncbi:MAG: glycosyltransferase family 2 protein [Lachnospiraceae bacterium]|nr:glycosyltransferase family 2 protein [Lachnospiraceae bacterium]